MPKAHPMQPLVLDENGVLRFKENGIVRLLLSAQGNNKIDLDTIAAMVQQKQLKRGDYEQFYQLIGYSVSGFGDISMIRRSLVTKADEKAAKFMKGKK